jgi:chromosome segregation ATPase
MWTDTVNRVLAERIEALENRVETYSRTLVSVGRGLGKMRAELAAMTVERDALQTTANDWKDEAEKAWAAIEEKRREVAALTTERDDWKHTANEETRSAERAIAELTAERDRLREQLGCVALLGVETGPVINDV